MEREWRAAAVGRVGGKGEGDRAGLGWGAEDTELST